MAERVSNAPEETTDSSAGNTSLLRDAPLLSDRSRYLVWVAFCVLIAFLLRTYRLDLQSLWYDEGVTVDIARRTLPDLTRWTAQDIQPPLYYYVVSAWGKLLQLLANQPVGSELAIPMLWGGAWSEWSVRFVSVLFGTLTVPLMASLAVRLTRGRLAGAIAALLAALHPLLFYYSQEARMYAMLTFLGMLAGYILFGGLSTKIGDNSQSEEDDGVRWWLFILASTAAVYTHYFAFFLLAALGIGYLMHSPADSTNSSGRFRARLGALVSAGITILILYVPWFVALFSQLRDDSSYWQGKFKLSEAISKVAISFAAGETVTDAVGLWLLIPVGLVTIASILALGWPMAKTPREARGVLFITLLWWLIPTASVLLLAVAIPKFNSRYVMLGLPGLILLWSAGLSPLLDNALFHRRNQLEQSRSPTGRSVPSMLATASLAAVILIFVYADRNYFTDPEFTKTQWRPLARYVEKRIPPEDVVILTSGHTWPIWNYYAPHIPAVSVPPLRILDVNSVLDYPAASSQLASALFNRQGAWLVSWQDEVVDPTDVVPLLLERAGDEVPSERDYWDISLRRFENLDHSQLGIDLGSALSINYASQLVLRGYDLHETGELLLYWQRHAEYKALQSNLDLRLTGQLQTPEGLLYAFFDDQPLTVDEWPTTQWRPEQLVVSRVPAEVWAGTGAMPGTYGLQLRLYDPAGDLGGYDILNDEGQPVGKQRTLPVRLAAPTAASASEPDPAAVELLPNVYASFEFAATDLEAGQSLPVEVHWWVTEAFDSSEANQSEANQSEANQSEANQSLEIKFSWQDSAGEAVGEEQISIAPGFPLSSWPVGQRLRTIHKLQSDADLPPDQYMLTASLRADGNDNGYNLPIANIEVLPSTRTFDLPDIGQPVDAEFGGEVALRGLVETLALPPDVQEEQPLDFTVVWQATSPPSKDYSVSIQLLNADGKPVSQVDLQLPGGSASWISEQVETQSIELSVPAGFNSGQLIAVIYDAEADGFPRLRRQDGTDFVIIAQ